MGNFWLISQNGIAEPFPTVPSGGIANIYQIAPGQFLLAQTNGPLVRPPWRPGMAVPVTGDYVTAALGIQADAAENLINQVQTMAANQAMQVRPMEDGFPSPGGGGSGVGGEIYTNNYTPYTFNTNELYLGIESVSNSAALILYNATNLVYSIWGAFQPAFWLAALGRAVAHQSGGYAGNRAGGLRHRLLLPGPGLDWRG